MAFNLPPSLAFIFICREQLFAVSKPARDCDHEVYHVRVTYSLHATAVGTSTWISLHKVLITEQRHRVTLKSCLSYLTWLSCIWARTSAMVEPLVHQQSFLPRALAQASQSQKSTGVTGRPQWRLSSSRAALDFGSAGAPHWGQS